MNTCGMKIALARQISQADGANFARISAFRYHTANFEETFAKLWYTPIDLLPRLEPAECECECECECRGGGGSEIHRDLRDS